MMIEWADLQEAVEFSTEDFPSTGHYQVAVEIPEDHDSSLFLVVSSIRYDHQLRRIILS